MPSSPHQNWMYYWKKRIQACVKRMGNENKFYSVREKYKREGLSADRSWVKAAEDLGILQVGECNENFDMPEKEWFPEPPEQDVTVVDNKRTASPLRAVEWVFENIERDVGVGDAPSAGSWTLLQWARINQREFYGMFFSKLMPSKAQVDKDADRKEEGTEKIEELIKRAKESMRVAE